MTNDEYQALLDETEQRIERLRALYEQWFQGMERLEPQKLRLDVERRARALRQAPPRNTALRFRQQTILQRLVTLSTYWDRVAREIEEGRFRRGIERARRRARPLENAPKRATTTHELDLDADLELDMDALEVLDLGDAPASARPAPPPPAPPRPLAPPPPPAPPAPPAVRPAASPAASPVPPAALPVPAEPSAGVARFARPKRPPAAAPSTPRPPTSSGPSAARRDELFDRFVEARKKNNESVAGLRKEALSATIDRMIPALEKKHGGKRIDFEVVLKDGKVGLKPVPKDDV